MRHLSLPLGLIVICTALPAAAHGQAGQRPDPDSPAGVEYQLPLQQARANATPDGKDKSAGRGTRRGAEPLFGVGIVPRKDSEERGEQRKADVQREERESGAGSRSTGTDDEDGGGAGAASSNPSSRDPTSTKSAGVGADSGDGSATLRVAGIALGVLLAGGLLGLGLRRGLRQTAD